MKTGNRLIAEAHPGNSMIQIFPAEKRYIQRMGWLDVYSVFSCNNYFDPWNTHFANLIAFNEYVMQPGFGFNMHPHEDI